MKYLRGSSLGIGPVLYGLRTVGIRFRTFKRLPPFRCSKVTYCSSHTMSPYRYFPRRHVSTGPRKSQMAAVGTPSKIAVMPPNPVEISKFISSVPGKCRSRFSVSPSKLPKNTPPLITYGEFLTTSCCCSKNNKLDPFAVESAFLPTFHSLQEEFHSIFGDHPACYDAPKVPSPSTRPSEHNATDDSDRPSSLDNISGASGTGTPQRPDNANRQVIKEIILPRELKQQELSLHVFADVHRFDESDGKDNSEKKDIGGFPHGADHIPAGQFIIHSDRSSYIINKDLYITNRILDNLKKRGKHSSTDGEPSQPIVKASSVTEDLSVAKQTPLQNGLFDDQKLQVDTMPECSPTPPHKSKSDTQFLPSTWTYLNPAPNKGHVAKNLVSDITHSPDDTLHEFRGSLFKDISSSSVRSRDGFQKEDSIVPDSSPSNVEFSNSHVERFSPSEFRAFESRKNLYKRLLRNTPCYLVDGLHIQNASTKDSDDSPKLPDDSFNRGDSEELSHYLPNQVDQVISLEISVPSNENHLNNQEHDQIFEQTGDLEDWFVPLGKEIDSMLTALSVLKSNPSSDLDAELFLNQGSQQHVNVQKEFTDFKDCVDHVGDSNIFDVTGVHFENGMIPFEGLKEIESALLKSNHDPGTSGSGRVLFSSNSTTQKTPIPPKQNNPNVDIKTETTIKCCRSGDNTDINVIETQRYLDKRLPYPFSTETVLQVYGTNDSLYKATQAVENSKSQLVHLSNANTPNPGMTIPKLQFNHMLSKTHELTNQNSTNKKRVLKIKIVPESSSQYSTPPNVSSNEQSSVSHVLHAPKQPSSDVNKDALEFKKKTKYPHKITSRKTRRSESAKQLKSRKKQSIDDIGENITVLSPKDLERMFPTPPKPKPVEKPRNVTVNNQAANTSTKYNASNLVEASKAISKITLKAKKKKDQWFLVNKKTGTPKPNDSEARNNVPQASAKAEKEQSAKKLGKNDKEAGLSPRDQKILKTIISHKVKDSFTAVSQRKKNIKEETAIAANDREVRKSSNIVDRQFMSSGTKTNQRAVDRDMSEAKAKLLENLFKGSENLMSPPTRFEEPKVAKERDSIKNLQHSSKVSEKDRKTRKHVTVGKEPVSNEVEVASKRNVSPTPINNREYVAVKADQVKSSRVSTKARTPEPPKSPAQKFGESYGTGRADSGNKFRVIQPTMGSILPLSPKVIVDNAPRSTPNDQSYDNPKQPNSAFSAVKQVARSNTEKLSNSNKPDSSLGSVKSKLTKTSKSEVKGIKTSQAVVQRLGKHDVNQKELDKSEHPNKQWQPPSDATFFPFETPTVKELEPTISTPHGESLPLSPSSSDPLVYESDFCKLSAESNPGLDVFSQAQCKVPLSRVKEFPMINESKMSYSAPKMAISIKHNTDLMLRRTLSQMPAVTKVLGATLSAKSQQALERWKQGLVSSLGEEGFKEFVENQLRQGSNFHSSVSKFLLDKMDCKDDLCMKSMSKVFPHITDIGVIESQVVHPQLAYRGVVDCVAKYKGKPVAIEWKRSDKAKPTIKHTYDAPLQLCAYIGALNFDNNYKLKVDGGIVVVAYSDGSPADVFEIPLEECQSYWSKWLKRLYKFYSRP